MKKFAKIAFGVYMYWVLDACAWSIARNRGYKLPKVCDGWDKFMNWSADAIDDSMDAWCETFGWDRTDTKEEDVFDPDDYDWEHIHITVK